MTTRQALKRTAIGHSKSIESLMVHITWTSAKVVRIEAHKDFTLAGATVKVLRGEYSVLADAPVSVRAGQVLYFCQSDGFPGWYYVLTYNEARFAFNCSCPQNYWFHKQCSHQQHAMAFVGHRYARRIETEHFIDPEWELHVEDELRQAKQERAYEHLASVPLYVEEASVEYSRVA
jgi:hypothetical protein